MRTRAGRLAIVRRNVTLPAQRNQADLNRGETSSNRADSARLRYALQGGARELRSMPLGISTCAHYFPIP